MRAACTGNIQSSAPLIQYTGQSRARVIPFSTQVARARTLPMLAGTFGSTHTPPGFTRTGGAMEMVQLWVNLPARSKMEPPGYQNILDAQIPSVALPGGAGRVRVIAGAFDGHKGPARTHTPMDVWDLRLTQGKTVRLPLVKGHTAALVVLAGTVLVNGEAVAPSEFGRRKLNSGDSIEIVRIVAGG